MKRISLFLSAMLAGLMWLGSISLSAQEGNHAVRERVHFRFSRSAVDSTYRGNASSISRLDAAAAADGLQYVQVRVSSSPDGPEAVNARLARERASSVKAWLKERYPQIPDSLVRTIIVPEDWDGVARYISRTAEPWKAEALTIISGNKADREARLKDLWVGEAWENLMKHSFPLLRRAEIQFVFGTSAPQDVEGQVLPEERPSVASPSGDVLFAVGKTALVRDFAANAAAIDAIVPDSGKIYLDGGSSPEGKASYNNVLAKRRAESVRSALVAAGVADDRIVVRSEGEDWEGFRANVLNDYSGADRDEVLWILDDSSLGTEAKKSALRALDGGRTWRALIASHMSNLRRVRISFDNIASGSAPAASEPAVSTGEDTLAREKSPADTLNSAL